MHQINDLKRVGRNLFASTRFKSALFPDGSARLGAEPQNMQAQTGKRWKSGQKNAAVVEGTTTAALLQTAAARRGG
jgi:hypothetical protein